MEKIIIIGLLITIVLLLLDKKFSSTCPQEKTDDTPLDVPSVIGEIKKTDRQLMQSTSDQRQEVSIITDEGNFDSETKEEIFDRADQKKDPDDISVRNNDWEEEEEDWQDQEVSQIERGLLQGLPFRN